MWESKIGIRLLKNKHNKEPIIESSFSNYLVFFSRFRFRNTIFRYRIMYIISQLIFILYFMVKI